MKLSELIGSLCFVDFGKSATDQPTVHVRAERMRRRSHSDLAYQMARNARQEGQPHKDGVMRRFMPDYERSLRSR